MKSIVIVDGILENVLRFDDHLRLLQDLIKTSNAKKNSEQVTRSRLQPSTPPINKRKSVSQLSLEMIVNSSNHQYSKLISPPPRKKSQPISTQCEGQEPFV